MGSAGRRGRTDCFQPGGAEVSRGAVPVRPRRLRHRALRRRPGRVVPAQVPGVLRGRQPEAVQLDTAPAGEPSRVRREGVIFR